MACKHEREMLQLELYVADVEPPSALLTGVFGLVIIESKPGWRHLRHPAMYDVMLFDPARNVEGEIHWPMPAPGNGGSGVEIVLCTTVVAEKRRAVQALGYDCSELRHPPWGSTEFLFRLPEGYLLRVKQPPEL